jgi:uncharacterized protein (DUF849 family)
MAIFLKAAINGSRAAEDHPELPVSADMIARDAAAVVTAGADAVHFHIRDEDGYESLAPEDAGRCILACREAVPGILLGVSTGEWIVPDLEARLVHLKGWQILPDFASVNFHEDGAVQVAQVLSDLGVGIELGLADASAAERALAAGWGTRCMRVLLEPDEDTVEAALANVAATERLLDQVGVTAPRLLHGYDATAWALLRESAKRGNQCRIGLEDTLRLPHGELAEDNAEIIRTAAALITS